MTRAYAQLGQFDDAWRSIGEASTLVKTTKETWCEAEVNRTAGEIALVLLEPGAEKAAAYFERALAVARGQQAKSWELRAAISLARLWRDQGKRQQTHDLLGQVYAWLPRVQGPRPLLGEIITLVDGGDTLGLSARRATRRLHTFF
jgi:predicted ATPase